MAAPFFYTENITDNAADFALNEEASKHAVQVLRMQNGDSVLLTNGRGLLLQATISDNNKRSCALQIVSRSITPHPTRKISIAISPVKNVHRFEWFLEKATEIGVWQIIPLICARTEKQHIRIDRMKNILISAMLQSKQCWLPVLTEPQRLSEVMKGAVGHQKLIAHCEAGEKKSLQLFAGDATEQIVFIGPEGDFTKDEIELSVQHGCLPVHLGNTRLRTETAGLVAATLLVVN
jgi:16S rRNA (uracil1498-N3)-methyltransferase